MYTALYIYQKPKVLTGLKDLVLYLQCESS